MDAAVGNFGRMWHLGKTASHDTETLVIQRRDFAKIAGNTIVKNRARSKRARGDQQATDEGSPSLGPFE
jgi:hypothetical protein